MIWYLDAAAGMTAFEFCESKDLCNATRQIREAGNLVLGVSPCKDETE